MVATETAKRVDLLDATLAGRGGLVLAGEFLMIGEKRWGEKQDKVDVIVQVNVNGAPMAVRYRDQESAVDALGGSIPMAGTAVLLRVFARAAAKDFLVLSGIGRGRWR